MSTDRDTVFRARLAVLTAQAALHSAMAALLVSESMAAVHAARAAAATALIALDEIAGGTGAPEKPKCRHCGGGRILESVTGAGTNYVCGDCGEDPLREA